MLFSKQKWFCQICGQEQSKTIGAPYEARVCSKKCWHEWERRKTLSIMGQEYCPDPRAYDAEGNPVRNG